MDAGAEEADREFGVFVGLWMAEATDVGVCPVAGDEEGSLCLCSVGEGMGQAGCSLIHRVPKAITSQDVVVSPLISHPTRGQPMPIVVSRNSLSHLVAIGWGALGGWPNSGLAWPSGQRKLSRLCTPYSRTYIPTDPASQGWCGG